MEATVKPASLLDLINADLPPETCWISNGVLPKSGTLLFGGVAKAGKSFVMLELARALATGDVPFGHPQLQALPPVKVLLVEQELGVIGLQKRVKPLFATEDPAKYGRRLFYASKIPSMQLNTAEGRRILHGLVEEIQPNVLLLDPIGRMHGFDENRSDQIQELFTSLERLVKLYEKNGMSIVLSQHYGKPGSDPSTKRDPLDPYNFRGSSKFFDCPDSLLTMQRLADIHGLPWKAWEIKARFETRQDEPPKEVLLSVNAGNDRRVRFVRFIHNEKPAPVIECTLKQKTFLGVDD